MEQMVYNAASGVTDGILLELKMVHLRSYRRRASGVTDGVITDGTTPENA